MTKRQRLKRFFRRMLITAAILSILLLIEEIVFLTHTPQVYSQRGNAMWIRHHWVMDKHTEADYQSLAKMLRDFKVRDAYFHCGPFEPDGTVRPERIVHARDLIRAMKRLCPEIRLQPWLGQTVYDGGGRLKLSAKDVRANILKTSEMFLNMGFDGIHYDFEPVYSGNTDYLKLLNDAHKLTSSHKAILSLAAAQPEPVYGMEWVIERFARNPGYWTRDYFLQVAETVDQVAVMTYDSGMPTPGIYGREIAWTARWAVENGVDDLLIGIPTYGKGSPAHMTWAENVPNALRGLKRGVSSLKPGDRRKVGAAVFAEWTTSSAEKHTYREMWIKR